MAPELLIERVKEVAQTNYTHKHYKRTCELADFYYQILTGEDQKELIISYKPNETASQKQQRLRITNTKTAYIAGKVFQQWKEIQRNDQNVDNIDFVSDSQANQQAKEYLNTATWDFYNGLSVTDYVHDFCRRMNFYDPNAWLVEEFYYDFEGNLRAAPLELYSHNCVDYKRTYGVLDYVIGRWSVKCQAGKKEYKGYKYTIYGKDYSVSLTEIGEQGKCELKPLELYDGEAERDYIYIEDLNGKVKVYLEEVFETMSGEVPAIQSGYIRDAQTKWETFVGILESARNVFLDLINSKSEYDLHKALHGFIQKYAFVDKCTYTTNSDAGAPDRCDGGKLRLSGQQCPKCKGTGVDVHTTVQDVIYVAKPEDKSQMIELDKLVHYVEIPKHIIDGHKEDLKEFEREVSLAIFNANVFDRSEIAMTATEKRLNLQGVYNAFGEFCNMSLGRVYPFIIEQLARYNGFEDQMTVSYHCPQDYRLETIAELLQQRKSAIDAGAPYEIVQALDVQIMQKQHQDDPLYVAQMKAADKFKPFRGKTKDEVLVILSMLPQLHPKRILWMFFDDIFEAIFANPAYAELFHKWSYNNQKEVVGAEVKRIIEEEGEMLSPSVPDWREIDQLGD